jgi:hypothetical protein
MLATESPLIRLCSVTLAKILCGSELQLSDPGVPDSASATMPVSQPSHPHRCCHSPGGEAQ